METVIFCTTFIPMGAMVLHARMFFTLAHMTSICVGAIYLHGRTFWTLSHTTSIPVGAIYLHARTFCTLSDTILYPLRAPIFTMITEVWPCANLAVVTNNSTMIIQVVLIESFLYMSGWNSVKISLMLLLLLLKKVGSARLRESDVHPISLKTPAPQYQPIDRMKRRGKRVEDYSRDRAA